MPTSPLDNTLRMRFGTAGTPVRFTALHCAVHEIGEQCNVHIVASGFVLSLPDGISLTPDLHDHIVNELKWETDLRSWLAEKMPNAMAGRIVKDLLRGISFNFPNALNGYADLGRRINELHKPEGALDTAKTAIERPSRVSVTLNVYLNDIFKLQVTGSNAAETAPSPLPWAEPGEAGPPKSLRDRGLDRIILASGPS